MQRIREGESQVVSETGEDLSEREREPVRAHERDGERAREMERA